ncbi:MAG: tetratricopeptide repeat protein, partial [Nitrospirota bacterium]
MFQEDINGNKNNSPSPPFEKGGMGGFSDELDKQFKNALQLINNKSYKEAENILLSFVVHDLYPDKVYFLLGRLYKEQGFFDKAEDCFKKAAVNNYLLKDYAFKLLTDTYIARKEFNKAVETARQIQNKILAQEAKQSEIASLLALKDEESAINVLSQYIKEYPGDWNYKLLLAQVLKNKERDKAINLFKEIYINAALFSTDALKELEDMDAAKFTLEETLKRAENLLKNGSFESAETAFKKILKSIKDSVLKDKISFSIGTCQFKQKKYSEAAKTFDLIKTPEAMYWRARAVYRADDTKDFEGIIKKFEKEYPWNQYLARLFILLADGKRRMGNLNEAEEIFKKVSN